MIFLLTGFDCGGEVVLMIIKYVFLLLKLVFFIVPIGLIVMLSVDFVKNVTASDEGAMKKNLNVIIKRIIMCMALFLVDPIVHTTINLLGDLGIDYVSCIKIAENGDLTQYKLENIIPKPSDEKANANIGSNPNFSTTESKDTTGSDNGTSSSDGNESSSVDGNIFIGDSRFEGMKSSVDYSSDNVTWISKVGVGYSWLKDTAVSKLSSSIQSGKKYNIVINLGVNDLGNVDSYIKTINSLINDSKYNDCKFIVVSVNPVEEDKEKANGYSVKNGSIKTFNKKMKNGINSSAKYCDTYSKIVSNFSTADGVHYTKNTYQDIYSEIKACL